MNYPVADFIIRLKNSCLSRRKEVTLPYSKLNLAIGKLLVKSGYLEGIKEDLFEGKKNLIAKVKYEKRNPVIQDVALISKPSLRVYTKAASNAPAANGRRRKGIGIAVVSTSSGVMSEKEAGRKGIGGELLFEIW